MKHKGIQTWLCHTRDGRPNCVHSWGREEKMRRWGKPVRGGGESEGKVAEEEARWGKMSVVNH